MAAYYKKRRVETKLIVFSRNRPYQLTACLGSAVQVGKFELESIAVMHRYDEKYSLGLHTVVEEFPRVKFIREVVWDQCLRKTLELCGKTMAFATDDSVFTRECPWNLGESILGAQEEVLAFSHRYGLHLDYCNVQKKPVCCPDGAIRKGVFYWRWTNAGQMWDFLGSVDAHQFRTSDITQWVGGSRSPNTLEDCLHRNDKSMRPIAACMPVSCYLTIPANRVQEDHLNETFGDSVDEYYRRFLRGDRPRFEYLRSVINHSTHQMFNI